MRRYDPPILGPTLEAVDLPRVDQDLTHLQPRLLPLEVLLILRRTGALKRHSAVRLQPTYSLTL